MSRTSTPLDPLEPLMELEEDNSIPVNNQPWFSIGQAVGGVVWLSSRFYLKQLLKESGKKITRDILDFLKHGKNLEYSIAGIEAHYGLPTMMVVNQCYLQDGQCHSGLNWQYKVLIKGVLEGKNVCVIPKPWIREQDFFLISEINFQTGEGD